MITDADRQLFVYYKSYRANIRAKVNSLRARSAASNSEKAKSLSVVNKYLGLMENYINSLRC
jgi:aminoglycoside phosphotransferase family enzyme